MINKNIIFIWLTDSLQSSIPNFLSYITDYYQKLNPDFKIISVIDNVDNPQNENLIYIKDQITSNDDNIYKSMHMRYWSQLVLKRYPQAYKVLLSDCLRFHLLDKFGGIYVDFDTFPIKKFDDELLKTNFIVQCSPYAHDIFFIGLEKNTLKLNYFDKTNNNRVNINNDYGYQIIGNMRKIKYYDAWIQAKQQSMINNNINHIKNNNLIAVYPLFSNHVENYYIDHYRSSSWRNEIQINNFNNKG